VIGKWQNTNENFRLRSQDMATFWKTQELRWDNQVKRNTYRKDKDRLEIHKSKCGKGRREW
jgi:hypothetical protein